MILQSYYENLERLTSLDYWDLLKQLSPIEEVLDKESQDRIRTEKKILSFSLNNGTLNHKLSKVDIKGKIESYPNLTQFTDVEIKYIINRIHSVNNVFIKSRYAHVLWSITKNSQYAKTAILNYSKIINDLFTNPSPKAVNKLSIYSECILYIGEKSKQEFTLIETTILNILNSGTLPHDIKSNVLKTAINNRIIPNNKLAFLLEYMGDWINLKNDGNYFSNKSILNTAILLAEKLHQSTHIYYNLLAENQDLILHQHLDETDFVRFMGFGEKAKYYKKAGNSSLYETCLNEYTRLKHKMELSHVKFQLPEAETLLINDYLNNKAEIIISWPLEQILVYFSNGEDLLIKEEVFDELTKNNSSQSLYDLFTINTFDINANHKRLVNKEDSLDQERFQTYQLHFALFFFPLMIKVFSIGILCGKIEYVGVFRYLEKNSWFGQKFELGMGNRDLDKNSNWLSLIAPGLYDYFSQIEWTTILPKNSLQTYILCIDSLTTKFEGALRDFIRLQGGSTTIEKKGELQEQVLENLLENQIIKDLFSNEDITLFQYVFTKKGWNIRNNVTHCFYPYSNYSFEKATLIFICLLRLGKYQLI